MSDDVGKALTQQLTRIAAALERLADVHARCDARSPDPLRQRCILNRDHGGSHRTPSENGGSLLWKEYQP